jgi:hypothetical protein
MLHTFESLQKPMVLFARLCTLFYQLDEVPLTFCIGIVWPYGNSRYKRVWVRLNGSTVFV